MPMAATHSFPTASPSMYICNCGGECPTYQGYWCHAAGSACHGDSYCTPLWSVCSTKAQL
jgi:hypothetical protein